MAYFSITPGESVTLGSHTEHDYDSALAILISMTAKCLFGDPFFLVFLTEEILSLSRQSPIERVMPSPYAKGVPNSFAGVIISPARLYYDFVGVHEFSSRLTTFSSCWGSNR